MLDLAHDSFEFDDVAQARSPGSSGSRRRSPASASPSSRSAWWTTRRSPHGGTPSYRANADGDVIERAAEEI